jgi:hypothetical protein
MEEAKKFLDFLHWCKFLATPEVSFPAYSLTLSFSLTDSGKYFNKVAILLGMLGSCHLSVGPPAHS